MLVIGVYAASEISGANNRSGEESGISATDTDPSDPEERESKTEESTKPEEREGAEASSEDADESDPEGSTEKDPEESDSETNSDEKETEDKKDEGDASSERETEPDPNGDGDESDSAAPGVGRETEPESAEEPKPDPKFTVEFRFWDRDPIVAKTDGGTVRQILADNGYTLDSLHVPTIGADEYVAYDAVIEVLTLSYETVNLTEEIPYTTDYVYSDSLPSGQSYETTAGSNGYKQVMYTIEYINGEENYRSLDSEYVTTYPQNRVVTVGTAPSYVVEGAGVIYAADGTAYSYSKAITVTTTYYNLGGNTASGLPVGDGIVATDPSVIPMGTSIYLKCDTLDLGVRYAADTGVYGNWVDVWMNESSPYFSVFAPKGVWEMTCYILN